MSITVNRDNPLYNILDYIDKKDKEIALLKQEKNEFRVMVDSSNMEIQKLQNLLSEQPKIDRINKLIIAAKFCMMINIPYVFGAEYHNNKAFDCSSFVQALYKFVGTTLPRVTRDQAKLGTEVESLNNINPGDLVFFKTPNTTYTINHVGMDIGNGQFIHTNNSNENINIQNWETSDYTNWIVVIKRIIK